MALGITAENKVKIVRAGGIEVLLSAMRAHEGHEGVQEAGCRALLMVSGDSTVTNELRGFSTYVQKAYDRHKSKWAKQLTEKLAL